MDGAGNHIDGGTGTRDAHRAALTAVDTVGEEGTLVDVQHTAAGEVDGTASAAAGAGAAVLQRRAAIQDHLCGMTRAAFANRGNASAAQSRAAHSGYGRLGIGTPIEFDTLERDRDVVVRVLDAEHAVLTTLDAAFV